MCDSAFTVEAGPEILDWAICHEDLVRRQSDMLEEERAIRRASYVAAKDKESTAGVSPLLRIMSLVVECRRYELQQIHKLCNKQHSDDGHPPSIQPERLQKLLHDTNGAYESFCDEAVQRLQVVSETNSCPETMGHCVATNMIRQFATFLPCSDGIAGALSEIRCTGVAVETCAGATHDLHDHADFNDPMGSACTPRGCATGLSGRIIPVSFEAQMKKGDKLSEVRRARLAEIGAKSQRCATPAPRRWPFRPLPSVVNFPLQTR